MDSIMIVDKINSYLSNQNKTVNEAILEDISTLSRHTFKRQFMETNESRPAISLSSAGKCPRQQAYKYHGFEVKGKELDSRSQVVFWTGDSAEIMVVNLAKLAGCNIQHTGLNQKEVHLIVNGEKIEGHPDGILDDCLFECKSMSSYGFKLFELGDIDYTYLAQINVYMHCLGLNKCVMVALAKDSGVLGEQIIHKDNTIVADSIENVTKVLKSSKDSLPDRRFGPNEKGFYPWNCLYCSYWGHCVPKAQKVLVGKSYKLKDV